jgi:hypothetical protein
VEKGFATKDSGDAPAKPTSGIGDEATKPTIDIGAVAGIIRVIGVGPFVLALHLTVFEALEVERREAPTDAAADASADEPSRRRNIWGSAPIESCSIFARRLQDPIVPGGGLAF